MSISASNIVSSNTLNELRTQFNNLVTDVTAIEGGTLSYTVLETTTLNSTTLNVKEDGTIIFEGATEDSHQTTLTVVDPTADRTITFPNETGTVHTSGGDTTHTNIIIADGANIGSASDTNAMSISSGGVVSITATTANTSVTDGALTVGGGLGVAADVSIGDDLRLISDATVLSFGANSDVTLTHVHDTGLLLNGTSVIQFNDASQSIGAPSNAILDINATDEIELNATLLDVNANINASGTYTGAGLMTTGGNIVIPDAGTIGSATDVDAIAIGSDGDITLTQDLELQHDGAILSFGTNDEVTLTHVHDTGLLLNGTSVIQFNDASQSIGAPSNAILDINATDEIELNATLIDINGNVEISGTTAQVGVLTTTATQVATGGITSGSNIVSDTDSTDDLGTTSVRWANLFVDAITTTGEITATGFTGTLDGILGSGTAAAATTTALASTTITASGIIKTDDTTNATSTTDGSLQTDGGLSVALDAVFGDDVKLLTDSAVLSFGAGSDATLTHTNDVGLTLNSTNKLMFNDATQFIQGASGTVLNIAATDEVDITSTLIDINGNVEISGTTAQVGVATFTARDIHSGGITVADAGNIGSASDLDAIAIGADGDITLTQDLELQHDGAILSFGANDEIALTHVHDTGLLLTDSGGSPTLQLHNASEAVSSDGSKLILTSNGVAFSLPTADGDSGQVMTTNGSGVFAFADVSASSLAADDISGGDAAILLTTSSGNITVDAAAGDSDIIFKGTDGSADTVFLTIDGSDGGTLIANHNLELGTDASAILFGANNEVILTHVHDKGLALKHTATADGKPVVLTLQTGETDIAANNVIGKIDFQAPDEGTGTDAILVAAAIQARSEGDFAADNNATSIDFMVGASEAAATKMTLSSAGSLDVLLDITGSTINADGDTAAGDNAAMGYTAAEGLILTGQGSTNDITIKNDADADVIEVPTGTVNVTMAGTLTTAGAITSNAGVVVDEMTLDADTLTCSDAFIIDAAADITLDAAGDDILLKSAGTHEGNINLASSNLTFKSIVSDKDMIFQGNDGGSAITALTIDMSAAGAATFNNDVTAFSDERLKRDIETIPNALDKVCQMRGVTFERIDDEGSRSMGVIAQEIEKIIPEVVREDSSEEKIKSVAYGNLVGVLIEAIKELKDEVEQLKNK